MVEVKCDRWTCKHFQNDFCTAIEVKLETQGDCDFCCLTFEKYVEPEQHFLKGEM